MVISSLNESTCKSNCIKKTAVLLKVGNILWKYERSEEDK